ncbi:hypothetical protein, partial [Klebsiella pneumoniae]|uniref:hypothetical protein n=1 Tax=Klebsiella pneumoniae TaxID=573 RepID=UPI00224006B7
IPGKASRNTQFPSSIGIPLQTNHTKAKVPHIIRDESKSISYHAFSLSLSLFLFFPAEHGERCSQPALGINFPNLKLLPDCLPSLAQDKSSSNG